MPAFPAPDTHHPVILPDGSPHRGTVFLKPALSHPRIEVGDYTYASAHEAPEDWAAHLAPYLYDFSPEKLVIGRFCQIADGAMFITASANHRHDGFSSFPFAVFHREFEAAASMPGPGPDTILGNDIWIGQGARILPGARIGDGCIIGAGAVVSGVFPPYCVIVGNPARIQRRRFDEQTIAALEQIAWWNWPIETICAEEAAICGRDIARLRRVSERLRPGHG
ncbi:CatB-related O-acetyltransferase [Aquicoccus porphyridii]|uniref:CatB-related O-acetyltransferase n=1 Tax=Aquicoccus porphyridii TaxID=1852029 RepID=UPI00273D93DF|nr:CatB-related O-acetyltransferase [Aquicoccus porphyridii]